MILYFRLNFRDSGDISVYMEIQVFFKFFTFKNIIDFFAFEKIYEKKMRYFP